MSEILCGRKIIRNSPARVGKKIEILRGEGTPQKQAVAEALNMERKGRLTDSGGYKRVRRKGY